MGYVLLFILGIVALIIQSLAPAVQFIFANVKLPIAISVASTAAVYLMFKAYEQFYFASKHFSETRKGIQKYIDNCNELNHHIEELKGSYINIKSYDYGDGQMQDVSHYNFERKEWSNDVKNNFIHHCSASVCKNASDQPFKYFCKYFHIENTDKSLSKFENVLNDFAAAEQGKKLLQNERNLILSNTGKSIPWLINSFKGWNDCNK